MMMDGERRWKAADNDRSRKRLLMTMDGEDGNDEWGKNWQIEVGKEGAAPGVATW
jgi:hypothetical protein